LLEIRYESELFDVSLILKTKVRINSTLNSKEYGWSNNTVRIANIHAKIAISLSARDRPLSRLAVNFMAG